MLSSHVRLWDRPAEIGQILTHRMENHSFIHPPKAFWSPTRPGQMAITHSIAETGGVDDTSEGRTLMTEMTPPS